MNKKLTNGLLIALALLLVAGMAVQYTPSLGALFSSSASKGTPAIKVDDQVITTQDLDTLRKNNQVLNFTQSGVLGDDLKRLTVAAAIQQALGKQGSAGQEVSRSEVNDKVTEVRKSNNLTDNKAWTDRLAQIGLTDASFRQQVRDSLALQKQQKSITDAVPKATDSELQEYYDLNPDQFQSEAKIVGREIVVSDKAKAEALLAQLKGGADFSTLATQNSLEFKDRGGALGPVKDGKPSPVSQAALPTSVGAAAFALGSGGLTNVLEDRGKFYIVKVEQALPAATKPFAEAKTQVADIVNKAKQNAAMENWFDGLKKSAKIEYVDPAWKVDDVAVATVDGQPIAYSELLQNVVGSQQFQGLLQQVPADQAGTVVNQYLKPGATEQLIEQYAAPSIVKAKKLNLVGPRSLLAQQLMAYGSKDVTVSDDEIIKAYQSNIAQFTSKASANVSEAVFNDKQQALAFRQDFDGQNFVKAASKAGGTVSERGATTEGDPNSKLSPALTKAVFATGGLRQVTGGGLSEVVEQGKQYSVAYVTNLVSANVKSLSEVRDLIKQKLLADKRNAEGMNYLKEQMKGVKVENNLSKVLAAQQKAVSAAEPKQATPSSAAPGGTGTAPSSTAPATTPASSDAAPTTPATDSSKK